MPLKKASTVTETVVLENSGATATIAHITPAPRAEKPMTRSDWEGKDRRISRQGLFQAALQSPALMQYAPTLEAYIELVVRTANAGLAFVND